MCLKDTSYRKYFFVRALFLSRLFGPESENEKQPNLHSCPDLGRKEAFSQLINHHYQ